MTFEVLFLVLSPLIVVVIFLIIYLWDDCCIPQNEEYDNDIIKKFNELSDALNANGCRTSEIEEVLNALASLTEENTRPTEQKEAQQIFEPNYEIIEKDIEEPNTLDNWYDNFMKEIEQ